MDKLQGISQAVQESIATAITGYVGDLTAYHTGDSTMLLDVCRDKARLGYNVLNANRIPYNNPINTPYFDHNNPYITIDLIKCTTQI